MYSPANPAPTTIASQVPRAAELIRSLPAADLITRRGKRSHGRGASYRPTDGLSIGMAYRIPLRSGPGTVGGLGGPGSFVDAGCGNGAAYTVQRRRGLPVLADLAGDGQHDPVRSRRAAAMVGVDWTLRGLGRHHSAREHRRHR